MGAATEHLTAAREHFAAGRSVEAEVAARDAVAAEPGNPVVHRTLAKVLIVASRATEATAALGEAIRLDPNDAGAHKDLAIALGQTGHVEAALASVRVALALRPRYASATLVLTQLKRFTAVDPELRAIEELAADAELGDRQRVEVLFALVKALEDAGDYDRAFAMMGQANALKRRGFAYDVSKDVAYMARIRSVFGADLLGRLADSGAPTRRPILVVGMPRSGSSLVEQILASHPAVHGAGELTDLEEIAAAATVLSGPGDPFPEAVASLTVADLQILGHGYDERLRKAGRDAERVVDKELFNFQRLGLARLIVPNARVIHCVRDPVDVCVSCFGLDLARVWFASDLTELGTYHRAYRETMDHWREVLPDGWMLDVSYEDLVAEPEREARRMVAHVGLNWDPACLDFHRNRRDVRTASFAQVRQPIYRRSVERWRRYERHLEPLLAVLDL